MKKKKPVTKQTLVRIAKGTHHQWVTAQAELKPFNCDYPGAIKKGYGMTRKTAVKIVEHIARIAPKENIDSLVVFFQDPHLK